MRTLNYIISTLLIGLLALSCSTDLEDVQVKDELIPASLKEHGSIIIEEGNLDEGTTLFEWEDADYGYSAAIEYILWAELQTPQEEDDEPQRVGGSKTNELEVKLGDLNSMFIGMGIEPETEETLKFYVTSSISEAFPDGLLTSNQISVKVVPFEKEIEPLIPLRLPGNHQGWNPGAANIPTLYERELGKSLEGFVNLTKPEGSDDSGLQFKFLEGTSWGSAEWASPDGELSPLSREGDNITGLQWGYYRMVLNIVTPSMATVTASEITTIGLVGDAIPSIGWSEDDTLPMTYDKATNTWSVTTTLAEGGFKLRTNNSGWNKLMGSLDNSLDKVVYDGGDNINIDSSYAGQKKVTIHFDAYPYYVTITNP